MGLEKSFKKQPAFESLLFKFIQEIFIPKDSCAGNYKERNNCCKMILFW